MAKGQSWVVEFSTGRLMNFSIVKRAIEILGILKICTDKHEKYFILLLPKLYSKSLSACCVKIFQDELIVHFFSLYSYPIQYILINEGLYE